MDFCYGYFFIFIESALRPIQSESQHVCMFVCLCVCPLPVKFISRPLAHRSHDQIPGHSLVPLSTPPERAPEGITYVSCVTCHMSHVTCHMSHVTCHVSHVPFFSSSFFPLRVTCHVSHVMCHMSHVTCHMSHVLCHMSQTK